MAYIQTVLGPVDLEKISFCQSHEHLLLSKGVSYEKSPVLLLDDPEKSQKEVEDHIRAGGNTIIEAQPVGCNRVADGLVRIAQVSGANIVASTGFHKMTFYPEDHWIFRYDEERLMWLFISELIEGMYVDCDTEEPVKKISAKAGQIKTAFDTCGLTAQYEKLFRAAVRAAIATGAPMMVHIENGADPVVLADYLEKNELRPKNLIFCHMDRAVADVDVHKEIAGRGIYLEYDTIGRFKYHSDEREVEIFREMLDAGYEDMLLASLDTTRARLKTYTPDAVGLNYLIDVFIPMLKKAGVTEAQIGKIMRYNPRKAFSFQ